MKAILVIDMPEDCWDCPLHRSSWDEDDEEIMICRGTYMESHYGEIPDWCPLKPMPEKQAEVEDTDYIYEDYDRMAACIVGQIEGWNSCIEEILGEEE